jgi:uncharacterized membrane protein
MPFCASCGAPVEGRFCAKCGTPFAAAPPPAGAVPPGPPPPPQGAYSQPGPPPPPAAAGAPMAENVASTLCYVLGLVTGIIFLVIAPYNQNKTVRFHAFQSIFLNLAWIAVWIVFSVLLGMLRVVGVFGLFFLTPLISLAGFVLWIYMMISAYQGKTVVLPVIGPLARQQA